MSKGDYKNLQLIPRTLEDCVHAQERNEPLLLHNLGALCKQEVEAKAELSTAWLHVDGMPHMHTETLSKE